MNIEAHLLGQFWAQETCLVANDFRSFLSDQERRFARLDPQPHYSFFHRISTIPTTPPDKGTTPVISLRGYTPVTVSFPSTGFTLTQFVWLHHATGGL